MTHIISFMAGMTTTFLVLAVVSRSTGTAEARKELDALKADLAALREERAAAVAFRVEQATPKGSPEELGRLVGQKVREVLLDARGPNGLLRREFPRAEPPASPEEGRP